MDSMRTRSAVLPTCMSWIVRLLTDSKYYWHLFSLILVGEVVLCALVIRYVAYTNIDYLAYSQQAALFLPPNNVRDYSSLRGDTGPLVYPALHLYTYSLLHKRFPAASSPDVGGFVPGKVGSGLEAGTAMQPGGRSSLLVLQGTWAGVYLATLVAVAWIYRQAIRSLEKQDAAAQKKATEDEGRPQVLANVEQSLFKLLFGTSPPLQPFLVFLPLSKRLHSIYVLRLFNDPLAMLALYASVVLFCKKKWYLGALVYSLALSIKMNILLFLPGLLVLLFQYKGLRGTILVVGLIITIQILLPSPYFLGSRESAKRYFSSAFDLGREFMFKWSVNWRWVGEEWFLSPGSKWGLLGSHLAALITFAWFRWSSIVPGGTMSVLRRGLAGTQAWQRAPVMQGIESGLHIPFVLFTSNVLGILFARSLHYQFFSWYAHQLPFLLWLTRWPLAVCAVLWIAVLAAWDSFPPSTVGSATLFVVHVVVLVSAFWNGERRTLHEKV